MRRALPAKSLYVTVIEQKPHKSKSNILLAKQNRREKTTAIYHIFVNINLHLSCILPDIP